MFLSRLSLSSCAVTSPNPVQSGVGQIDDLAIWSRALAPHEVHSLVFNEGIRESEHLCLYYDFNEGTGTYARNKGRAGGLAKYDLVLGSSDVGGPTAYQTANKYGCNGQVPFTQPVWALEAPFADVDGRCNLPQLSASDAKLQPTGFGGKQFVDVKESAHVPFILEYFHPAGRKSSVRISRLPTHGRLEQETCVADACNRTLVVSAPFDISSSAYASLVSRRDRICISAASMFPS